VYAKDVYCKYKTQCWNLIWQIFHAVQELDTPSSWAPGMWFRCSNNIVTFWLCNTDIHPISLGYSALSPRPKPTNRSGLGMRLHYKLLLLLCNTSNGQIAEELLVSHSQISNPGSLTLPVLCPGTRLAPPPTQLGLLG